MTTLLVGALKFVAGQKRFSVTSGSEETASDSTMDEDEEETQATTQLCSHPLCDYKQCFNTYVTADVLVIDSDPLSREDMRARASKIVIKSKISRNMLSDSDAGRNVTVNTCSTRREVYKRLMSAGETYALVIIHEPFISPGYGLSLLKTLRDSGYKNAITMLFDKCGYRESKKCLTHGATACLVRRTGSLTMELTRLIGAFAIRYNIRRRERSESEGDLHKHTPDPRMSASTSAGGLSL